MTEQTANELQKQCAEYYRGMVIARDGIKWREKQYADDLAALQSRIEVLEQQRLLLLEKIEEMKIIANK